MLDRDRFLRLACLPIAAALIAACSSNPPIERIMNDPRGYVDRTVTIEGRVTDYFSLLVVKGAR